jgi:hypothetical protein
MHFPTYLVLYILSFQIVANLNSVNSLNLPAEQTQSETGQLIKVDHECHYPFNPSSIVIIIIFQTKGINYIAEGEERCAWHFAKEIETVIHDSVILPNYFKKKLLEKIGEAKKRGEII